jgi:hypothetical protein
MDIDELKRHAATDAIWINTNGPGLAVAQMMEAEGLPVNRFELWEPVEGMEEPPSLEERIGAVKEIGKEMAERAHLMVSLYHDMTDAVAVAEKIFLTRNELKK